MKNRKWKIALGMALALCLLCGLSCMATGEEGYWIEEGNELHISGTLHNLPNVSCDYIVIEQGGKLLIDNTTDVPDVPVTNYGTIGGGVFCKSAVVVNHGTIEDGVFNGTVNNYGLIDGGTFDDQVTNKASGMIEDGTFGVNYNINGEWPNKVTNNGTISGGTFNFSVTNNGTISGGTFKCGGPAGSYATVTNNGTISGGTFTSDSTVTNYGMISGGTFNFSVTNNGTISGGTFNKTVINNAGSTIEGGTFKKDVTNNGMIKSGIDKQLSFEDEVINNGTIEGGMFGDNVTNKANATIRGGEFNGPVTNNLNGEIEGGTFNKDVTNYGMIKNGTDEKPSFTKKVENKGGGKIEGGVFGSESEVYNEGTISGGTFNGVVDNFTGTISGGTFNDTVDNFGAIEGGEFGSDSTVTNHSTITNGKFSGTVTNEAGGTIEGGEFIKDSAVNNNADGKITDGKFSGTVNNGGTIWDGIFEDRSTVNNSKRISGGTFNGTVYNNAGSLISNGTFHGTVNNGSAISGGTFNGMVNHDVGTISGGTFHGIHKREDSTVRPEAILDEGDYNFVPGVEGGSLPDGLQVKVENGKYVVVFHVCADANRDHICDNGCAEFVGECYDSRDIDGHICDIKGCGRKVSGVCWDNGDEGHACNECGQVLLGECVDDDNDHYCDFCPIQLTTCNDARDDIDHLCDLCGAVLNGEPCWDNTSLELDVDGHICNAIGCGKQIDPAVKDFCWDFDKDGKCEECGWVIGSPVVQPTAAPTVEPTVAPTAEPTVAPTVAPVAPKYGVAVDGKNGTITRTNETSVFYEDMYVRYSIGYEMGGTSYAVIAMLKVDWAETQEGAVGTFTIPRIQGSGTVTGASYIVTTNENADGLSLAGAAKDSYGMLIQ